MTPGPYTVGPRTSLAKVARSMAKAKYGSAIVMDRGRIVGIFTATDALEALAGLIRGERPAGRTFVRPRDRE
ncbi:MAG TPA: CBS domain-containing protein [Candidatus Polarisedimenticolia bacterium]|nr:CBS domain-containing protein [Candidatus Polarisedimenticolia bacterium]